MTSIVAAVAAVVLASALFAAPGAVLAQSGGDQAKRAQAVKLSFDGI